jgi:hypothetical protein
MKCLNVLSVFRRFEITCDERSVRQFLAKYINNVDGGAQKSLNSGKYRHRTGPLSKFFYGTLQYK